MNFTLLRTVEIPGDGYLRQPETPPNWGEGPAYPIEPIGVPAPFRPPQKYRGSQIYVRLRPVIVGEVPVGIEPVVLTVSFAVWARDDSQAPPRWVKLETFEDIESSKVVETRAQGFVAVQLLSVSPHGTLIDDIWIRAVPIEEGAP